MTYLEKACTIGFGSHTNLHLVFASVQEKQNYVTRSCTSESIKGYAYLKIPAGQFLQLLSERNQTNPKIFVDNGSEIKVNFPTVKSDQCQPKFEEKNLEKIRKILSNGRLRSFAPLESLQMIGKTEKQMTKACFHFFRYGTFQVFFLTLMGKPITYLREIDDNLKVSFFALPMGVKPLGRF